MFDITVFFCYDYQDNFVNTLYLVTGEGYFCGVMEYFILSVDKIPVFYRRRVITKII